MTTSPLTEALDPERLDDELPRDQTTDATAHDDDDDANEDDEEFADEPADLSAEVVGRSRIDAVVPWLLAIGGAIGLAASGILTIDKFKILADPSYVPACSINAVLSCSNVMKSEQSALFGFPNSLIGIASFAAVMTLGVVMLSGAVLARWMRVGLLVGAGLGTVLCHYLAFTTLYTIGALCPYCMIVWSVTIPIFWSLVVSEVRRRGAPGALGRFIVGHPALPVLLWFAVMASLIFVRFEDFWLQRTT